MRAHRRSDIRLGDRGGETRVHGLDELAILHGDGSSDDRQGPEVIILGLQPNAGTVRRAEQLLLEFEERAFVRARWR